MSWFLLPLIVTALATQPKLFKAPDPSFAIAISPSFRPVTGTALQDTWLCHAGDLVCLEYAPGKNKQASLNATLEVRTVTGAGAKTCTAVHPTFSSVESERWIGKSKWSHSLEQSVGGGNTLITHLYKTWHDGQCWSISVNVYLQAMDTPANSLSEEHQVLAQLDAALRSFQFMK